MSPISRGFLSSARLYRHINKVIDRLIQNCSLTPILSSNSEKTRYACVWIARQIRRHVFYTLSTHIKWFAVFDIYLLFEPFQSSAILNYVHIFLEKITASSFLSFLWKSYIGSITCTSCDLISVLRAYITRKPWENPGTRTRTNSKAKWSRIRTQASLVEHERSHHPTTPCMRPVFFVFFGKEHVLAFCSLPCSTLMILKCSLTTSVYNKFILYHWCHKIS